MERADRLLYLAIDPVTERWIRQLNATATSLRDLYSPGKPRHRTYQEMTDRIVRPVLEGSRVCAAFYGHPGVLVHASQWAIRRIRRAGLPARMLPGISTEACLYADLVLNPGDHGVQSFEATDFLLSTRRFDPTSELILWQIGVLGETDTRDGARSYRSDRMRVLQARLREAYPAQHRVVLYDAASFPGDVSAARRVRLRDLARAAIHPATTLYVPALSQRPISRRMIERLDINP